MLSSGRNFQRKSNFAVFQELLKFKVQHFLDIQIHFWRTQNGAEVDFVIYKNEDSIIPIEVKFKTMDSPTVSRSFRSFIEAYQPKIGFFITKDFSQTIMIDTCEVHFISFRRLGKLLQVLGKILG